MPAAKAAVMPRADNRTRYTLDLTGEEHRFLKWFALEIDVEACKVVRVLLQLLDTDRALSGRFTVAGVSTRLVPRRAGLCMGDAIMVIGGPPCSPFSKSGPVRRREGQIVRRTSSQLSTELIGRCDPW